MRSTVFVHMATIALALVAGCGRSRPQATPTAPVEKSPAAAEESSNLGPAASSEQSANPSASAAPVDPIDAEQTPAVDKDSSTAAKVPVTPAERFLLFTPAGPLLCELTITVAGQSQDVALESLVDDAMAAALGLSAGASATPAAEPSWAALVESREFRSGRFGNSPIKTAEERKQTITRFDWNRNRTVDRDEMRRLLTRNYRTSGAVAWHAQTAGASESSTTLWQTLDVDANQVLSPDELSVALQRLRSRDARDDELLTAADFAPLAPADNDNRRRITPPAQKSLVQALSPETKWDQLWRTIREEYPLARAEESHGSRRAARLLDEMDRNGSGSISSEELAGLLERAPDLRITVHFADTPPVAAPQETNDEDSTAGDSERAEDAPPSDAATAPVTAAVTVEGEPWRITTPAGQADRVCLDGPDLAIEFEAHDRTPRRADPAATAQAQLAQYDRDSNGYLDRAEVTPAEQAIGTLEALDVDGDDKVYAEELAIYQQRQRTASQVRIDVYVGHEPDPVFAALDVDHNQRIGARELAGATARLRSFDLNADGQLTPEELPDRLTLSIIRGAPADDMLNPSRVTRPQGPPVRSGPAWFQRMDTNGDGDVSRREFLGGAELFQRMDTNGDGFLDASEAEQALEK